MTRREPYFALAAAILAAAAWGAARLLPGAPAAAGISEAALQAMLDNQPYAKEHMNLRLALDLGPPARPAFSRNAGRIQPGLRLRMDRLLGTVISAAGAAEIEPRPATPQDVPAAAPAGARPAARGPIRLDLLARVRDIGEPDVAAEPFAPRTWVVVPPPPPPPPPAPPEPPRAPPLPFRFAGSFDDGAGRTSFFLLRGNAMLTVAVGDRIDNTYVLDSAEGGVLQFTYLPLSERQRLPYGVPQ